MASRTAKAAERLEQDRARLTLVPEPANNPGMTKGDEARAAVVAALPAYQQAEYKRLVADGTRHPTALAAAKKVPGPATSTDDAAKQAAALFAAFAAAPGGAAAPPVTVAAATGKPVPDPEPQPAATAPKPAAPPKPRPATPKPPKPAAPRPAAPADGSCDRYIGTVTATDLGGTEQTFDCEHGVRNGHQTIEAAKACANRLLRNHPTGTPGTRLHPVKRDLNGRRLA